jgi:hypothetical protein
MIVRSIESLIGIEIPRGVDIVGKYLEKDTKEMEEVEKRVEIFLGKPRASLNAHLHPDFNDELC